MLFLRHSFGKMILNLGLRKYDRSNLEEISDDDYVLYNRNELAKCTSN